MVDGLSRTQAFMRITFPLLAPGPRGLRRLRLPAGWNEFTVALRDHGLRQRRPCRCGCAASCSRAPTRAIDWGQVMAASTIVAVPVIIFFLIVQGRMTADSSPGRSRADARAGSRRLPQGGRPMKVGLDVGGTKTDAVAVDAGGAIVGRVRLATGWGPEAVVGTVLDAVARSRRRPASTSSAIGSVGIGIPGQVEPGTARVRARGQPRRRRARPRRRGRSRRSAFRSRVENDVKAAALGAYVAARRRRGSMAYLNLGTGRRGGHRDRRASCGAARAAPPARSGTSRWIRTAASAAAASAAASRRSRGGGAIAERVGAPRCAAGARRLRRAEAGDPLAVELRAGLARGAAAAVRCLVLTADVESVVLGGGVTALGERLMADVGGRAARRGRGIRRSCGRCASRSGSSCCPPDRRRRRSAPRSSAPHAEPEKELSPWLRSSSSRTPRPRASWSPTRSSRLIARDSDAVLGLATGSTPLPVYEALRARLAGSTSRTCAASRSTSTSGSTRPIRRATAP